MGRINNQILGVIGFILHFNPEQKVTQLPPQPLEDHEGYKDSDFLFNSALTLLKRERVFFFLYYRNVEEAVKFPGLPRHRQLTYAIKQLIAREVALLFFSFSTFKHWSSVGFL